MVEGHTKQQQDHRKQCAKMQSQLSNYLATGRLGCFVLDNGVQRLQHRNWKNRGGSTQTLEFAYYVDILGNRLIYICVMFTKSIWAIRTNPKIISKFLNILCTQPKRIFAIAGRSQCFGSTLPSHSLEESCHPLF